MNLISKLVAAGSLLAMGFSFTTLASDQQSMSRLNDVADYMRWEKDLSCRDKASGRRLSNGESYRYSTTLYKGNTYYIFAAGDYDVKDLDIILYDENGNKIDEDKQTDALPIVEVTPRWSGEFVVKVHMYQGYGYSNFAICYR